VILALSLGYERSAFLRAVISPILMIGKPILVVIDKAVLVIFWPLWKAFTLLKNLFRSEAA
jgi:hypothetical protein